MNIAENILATVGNTALVRIGKLNKSNAQVLAKVEFFNPGGSAKDRVGVAMIDAAEKAGLLAPGAMIVEPTSGNTGVGLAIAAAVKGYKLVLTMPDTMSIERRKLLKAYGAELVLTPGSEGMQGAVKKANELLEANPGAFMPQQFSNPANAMAHELSTGPEIWRDTDGKVDILVAGVGTGGTLTGTGRYLKKQNPDLEIVAVEPAASPLLSAGWSGAHQLQGIGANFVPEVLDRSLIDRIYPVSNEDARNTARDAASREGILIGISGGAALFAALVLAELPENSGKNIVVILPDTGERYLSGYLFED
ncbi:MAG: cysteine synthase A [Lentisphaerae bacterium]|nr:cysteine synthase A [Lentisphaerota bacterium]